MFIFVHQRQDKEISSGSASPDGSDVGGVEDSGAGAGGDHQSSPASVRSFYVIRVVSRAPLAVVWLAFPCETPGHVRRRECGRVRELLGRVDLIRGIAAEAAAVVGVGGGAGEDENPLEGEKFVPACFNIEKPLEKLVLR